MDILDDRQTHNLQLLELRIDVSRVLHELPTQLQVLAFLLGKLSVKAVCARTGKSRSRIYQMTRQLRDAFIRARYRSRDPQNRVKGADTIRD